MAWKYITQDIIDAGGINVTSAEMFAEAREYNIEAIRNYNKKQRNHWFIAIWSVGQLVLSLAIGVILVVMNQTDQILNHTTTPTWRILLRLFGFLAYMGAFAYFVIYRRDPRPHVMALSSLPLLITDWKFAGIVAFNFLVGWLHEKVENDLRTKPDYPKFTRLIVTTSYSDSDTLSELTFDSIRDKARREHPDDENMK
jgi:hypothetical protein